MQDKIFLQRALALAQESTLHGDLPFGCLLVNNEGAILEEARNTVNTDQSTIGHCELNLVQQMGGKYAASFLQTCTIYCSVEPCPMCAGAIYWSGIGRIVFALNTQVYNTISQVEQAYLFEIPCNEILAKGGRRVEVVGPALQKEAADFYRSVCIQ
jgi:tRNA(Arg) A34 adenosine deaminase TadA